MATITKGTYGIFVPHQGEWKLVSTFDKKSNAEAELKYLREMLGLDAKLFVKE